jgi:hypothetical protein
MWWPGVHAPYVCKLPFLELASEGTHTIVLLALTEHGMQCICVGTTSIIVFLQILTHNRTKSRGQETGLSCSSQSPHKYGDCVLPIALLMWRVATHQWQWQIWGLQLLSRGGAVVASLAVTCATWVSPLTATLRAACKFQAAKPRQARVITELEKLMLACTWVFY